MFLATRFGHEEGMLAVSLSPPSFRSFCFVTCLSVEVSFLLLSDGTDAMITHKVQPPCLCEFVIKTPCTES